MRWLLLVLALTGCRQIFGIEDPHQGVGADAAHPGDAKLFYDAHVDALAAPGGCDTSETTLVACWDFDGNLKDTSPNHLDASDPGVVSFQPGKFDQAVDVNGTDVVVAEDTRLDLPAVTIEAWINPKQLPASGARMGIVDNNGQYGLFLLASGVRCASGATLVDLVISVPTSAWTHVACTSDGLNATVWVGVNKKSGTTTAIPTSGTTGLSLGANNPDGAGTRFDGLLDAIRIYRGVRADALICNDGQAPC